MTTYKVEQSLTFIYEVDADTPEDAAQIVRDGDAGNGECEDSTIESVTLQNDDWDAEDLRANLTCEKCGKTMSPKYQLTTCNDCYLAALRERLSA